MKDIIAATIAATATAHAAISVNLSGNSEHAVWAGLNASNYPGAGGTSSFFNPTAAWPAPIAGNSGSTSGALFSKVSGGGYFATSSVYDAGVAGLYSISGTSPPGDLGTLVFQIDAGTNVGVSPVLNYNGGTQALAADYFTSVAGNYLSSGPMGSNPSTNYAWQWDLSGVSEEIASYEIVWGGTTGNHLSQYELNVTAGENFVQVIPEPSSALFVSLVPLALFRRRRG